MAHLDHLFITREDMQVGEHKRAGLSKTGLIINTEVQQKTPPQWQQVGQFSDLITWQVKTCHEWLQLIYSTADIWAKELVIIWCNWRFFFLLRSSDGLTLPSWVRRIESLLMSLWMTPWEWRTESAFRTDKHTVAICSSFILKNSQTTQLKC